MSGTDLILGAVGFIRVVFEWGFWLLARGLMKPAFSISIALTYDAYMTPRFSFSKLNRMLIGETSGADAKFSAAKNSSSKRR